MELCKLNRKARLHFVAPLALAFAAGPAFAGAEDPALPSSGNQAAPPTACTGDVDGDGHVGFSDLLTMLSRYGATNSASSFAELLDVLSHYGSGCGTKTR